MKVNQNKIRVVVPAKVDYSQDTEEFWDGINTAIDQTLQSELPDVNGCVELDAEKIRHAIGYLLEERDFKRTLYEELLEDVVREKKMEYLQNSKFRAECDAEVAREMYSYNCILARLPRDIASALATSTEILKWKKEG